MKTWYLSLFYLWIQTPLTDLNFNNFSGFWVFDGYYQTSDPNFEFIILEWFIYFVSFVNSKILLITITFISAIESVVVQ